MKILLAHSGENLKARQSLDLWRLIRPFRELEKHVDWQIDRQDTIIDERLMNSADQINLNELAGELERIGQYDIVWTGYFPDEVLFDALMFVREKYGTKIVIDCDDDFWNVPPDNPLWRQENVEHDLAATKYVILETPYLVTSSVPLLKHYRQLRDKPTYLMQNYIGGYEHRPFNNGSDVVISFFGSVTHVKDLERTGFDKALRRLMKAHPQVRAGAVGLEIKTMTGTLRKRYTMHPGMPGIDWLTKLWPNINADIAVAPLQDNTFNRSKTNIKWQEAAMIPAAFVGSNVPPYLGTVEDGKTGLLVDDGEDNWYNALEKLVLDASLRKELAHNAAAKVKAEWMIADNWPKLKTIVEDIYNHEP